MTKALAWTEPRADSTSIAPPSAIVLSSANSSLISTTISGFSSFNQGIRLVIAPV